MLAVFSLSMMFRTLGNLDAAPAVTWPCCNRSPNVTPQSDRQLLSLLVLGHVFSSCMCRCNSLKANVT